MANDIVNGIPTARGFQKQIGRTGLRLKFKMDDQAIDTLLAHLQNAEYWRGSSDLRSVPYLRAVRKACLDWMAANQGNQRASRPHIRSLCEMIHRRLVTVVEFNLAKSKHDLDVHKIKTGMAAVHDEIRMLRAKKHGAGKSLDSHYKMERESSSHVPGPAGQAANTYYQKERTAGATQLSFEDWVTHILIPCSEDDPFRFMWTDIITGPNLNALKTNSVKYCLPSERDAYLLRIGGGLIRDASNAPYHTGSKQTAFSGAGWAIYVVDFDKNFYSESHVVNQFHHSSFLSGAPVQAAGEIAVDRGQLVAITNKTGHYKAGPAELARALKLLQSSGIDIRNVAVNDPFKAKDKWVSGPAALAAGGDIAAAGGVVAAPARVLP